MNFQNMIQVERSKDYLDLAFRKAREKSSKKLKGDWLEKIKKKEMIKLDVIKAELVEKLDKIIQSFPSLGSLPKFYVELLKLTLDYVELKKALGGVSWAIGKIRFFHKNYVSKISKAREVRKLKGLSKEFYGRVSSILKQIDGQLVILESSRKVMKKYPDVKEMFTVCIFGFPNVGKTTLLNKLTKAEGKIAAYAFTTLGVNAGYFETGGKKIQVLDVPGTLARVETMNEIEKIAYLVAKELAEVVVYVFDLSEQGGYSLKEQERLFRNLEKEIKEKKIWVYLSKKELTEEEKIKEFTETNKRIRIFGVEELKKELGRLV